MQIEKKIKQVIKSINMSTYILLVAGLIVYSPFIVQQLNSFPVRVGKQERLEEYV